MPPTPHRWRFRLRTLMVGVLVSGLLTGFLVRCHNQAETREYNGYPPQLVDGRRFLEYLAGSVVATALAMGLYAAKGSLAKSEPPPPD